MTDAEKEAQAAEAKAKVEQLEAELEKQRGIVENAEKKFQEWSAERGEERKSVAEIAKALQEAVSELRETEKKQKQISEELADAKRKLAEAAKGPTQEQGNNRNESEPTADEIEAGLTKAEADALDAMWENADEATRKKIKTDDSYRKRVLLKAKEVAKAEATADLSSWRKKPAQERKQDDVKADDLDELFKIKKRSAEHQPDGPSGGSPRGTVKRTIRSNQPTDSKAKIQEWSIESE